MVNRTEGKTVREQEVKVDWKPDKSSKTPVYKQIVNYMSGKISKGDWIIGKKLPPQRELAETLCVNRSTLVTAIDELCSFGILESDSRKGTRVASNTWSLLMSSAPPDWGSYLRSGTFHANVPTIQAINRLEFEDGFIRLGTGELSPDLFPKEIMSRIFARLPEKIPSLNYLGTLGLQNLREVLCRRLNEKGIKTTPSGILITSGSLQALHLVSVCMLKPGSNIYMESPSYLRSLQVFQSAGMRLRGIPMDEEGIQPWNIRRNSAENSDGMLYTIPSFHNPTGNVMSESRRKELFQFCSNLRLPIIEDDAYGELWLDEAPPAPLKALDESGMILYLGTVSKTLAPGLRIGWLVGPESVTERLGDVKMQMDYGASSLSQWALAELLESGEYDTYLSAMRTELKKRRDLTLSALEKYFHDLAAWSTPRGGFYIWLRLPAGLSTDKLFQHALTEGLLLNPGSVYDFAKSPHLRLSYAYAQEDELVQGLQKLSQIVRFMTQ